MTDQELEKMFPKIDWRAPLRVARFDGASGLACRLCIAHVGLKASEIPALPQTIQEFHAHMRDAHPD